MQKRLSNDYEPPFSLKETLEGVPSRT